MVAAGRPLRQGGRAILAIVSTALLLSACGGASQAQSPSATASGAAAALPSGAAVLDTKSIGSGNAARQAILASMPQPSGAPPLIELAIVDKVPAGWRLETAVTKSFALGPKLETASVGGQQAAGVTYHTGANSAGLLVIRGNSVVFDGVADDVQLQDLNGDGTPEVVKSWSPFCQSHVASPRLTTVYAWQDGMYAVATGQFKNVLAHDAVNFQAAVARANQASTTPAWTPGQKACLHDALAYIAQEGGDSAQAQAEQAQVRQLDPSYGVDAISKAAAGLQAQTSP